MTRSPTMRVLSSIFPACLLALSLSGCAGGAGAEELTFEGTRTETERFVDHYRRIELTAEQEAVRQEALGPIPASCCSQFSMATCCCECNLSRATWGLAKHLIAEKGLGAEAVREAVLDFHRALNPEGYDGDSCSTGKCNLPFRHDGCGGMKDGELVF